MSTDWKGGMDGLTWASFSNLIGIPMLPITVYYSRERKEGYTGGIDCLLEGGSWVRGGCLSGGCCVGLRLRLRLSPTDHHGCSRLNQPSPFSPPRPKTDRIAKIPPNGRHRPGERPARPGRAGDPEMQTVQRKHGSGRGAAGESVLVRLSPRVAGGPRRCPSTPTIYIYI